MISPKGTLAKVINEVAFAAALADQIPSTKYNKPQFTRQEKLKYQAFAAKRKKVNKIAKKSRRENVK